MEAGRMHEKMRGMKFVVSAQHRYAKYLFLPCMYKKHVDKLGWENTATVMASDG
jgi:hypothetical protein